MSDITKLTLLEAREKLLNKEISSVELSQAFIKKIQDNKKLNAFITTSFDEAITAAKESDKKIQNKNYGKLEGLPLAVKDLFCTEGIRTTAASNILKNFIPPYESSVTQKLKDQGYVLLGKTNMDSFACGSTNMTSDFGPVESTLKAKDDDRALIPGGSSGGSAVAVCGDMCLAATGSDTGGSIRQPAAINGLVGIKPTYGRVSRYGMVAYASSFDQAGWLTKDIKDAAYLTDIICGQDTKDSTTVSQDPTNFFQNINAGQVKNKKIGIIKEFLNLGSKVSPDIYKNFWDLLEVFKKHGCQIIELSIPTIDYVPELYTILSYTELASNLSRYDGVRFGYRTQKPVSSLNDMYSKTRSEGFCDNIKKRILLGYYFSSSENYEKYFLKAQKVRRKLVNEFLQALEKTDFLMTPTTPHTAFHLNLTEEEQKLNMESNYLNDLFVCPVNMAGLPGISIPTGKDSKNLPIGMHFISNYFKEQILFDIGLFLEQNLQ